MITYKKGNMLDSNASLLVNPVNCVGVSGKGLALQFKKKYPGNFAEYKRRCDAGAMQPGSVFLWKVELHKAVANMATKGHWRSKSEYEYIKLGLQNLKSNMQVFKINHVAIPKIGCGCGELDWDFVLPMIEKAFEDSDIMVEVWE